MTDPLQPDTRPFFMDVWREHRFRVEVFAKEANLVPEAIVLAMLRYEAVSKDDAQKVLATLSHLYSHEYTLDKVRVHLNQEEMRHDELE